MSGIVPLQEIYKKKGKEFVSKLFDSYVTVNEKLDASAFGLEKDSSTGEIQYYKRNTESPISKVDRTLMKFYEPPIYHFAGLKEEVKSKLPPGWRFGFEYFVNEQPQYICYDRIPKNGLVLSYIHVKNGLGEVVRTVQDKQTLDDWADKLDVERAPIIFQGKLTEDQKMNIMEFLDTSQNKLTAKYKTDSFVKYVITVLNPRMKKTALNEDLDKSIEGVVFRFGEVLDEDGPVLLAKLVDPVFEAISKERPKEEDDKSSDMYYILLMEITNFVESIKLKSIPTKGKTFDDRYINFISEAYNRFMEDFGERYSDFKMTEPSYLKKKEFAINDRFIDNPRTLALIETSDNNAKIFKVFLAAFRKKRKKANGIFTKEVVEQFNGTVEKVKSYLSTGLVTESESIPTFGEYLSMKGQSTDDDDDEQPGQSTDDKNFIAGLSDVTGGSEPRSRPAEKADKADVNVEKDSDDDIKKKKTTPKKVNMVVGRFQPFHNGHLEMAKELYAANKLPVLFVVVNTGSATKQSPFTEKTVATYMDNVVSENPKQFAGFVFTKRGFIDDIITAARQDYEPVLWGVGEDRVDDYQKQIELNYKKGNPLNLSDKFLIMQTKRVQSGSDIRKSIENDSFTKFKESVPRGVQICWQLLRNDIQKDK